MLSLNHIAILKSVAAMNSISGYNPTIGEVAKVAGVSKGIATRALEKLCGAGYIACKKLHTKKARYSFYTTYEGDKFLHELGRK